MAVLLDICVLCFVLKVLARVSPSKPSRKPVKPSREQLVGSQDASHYTTDDPTEPDCIPSALLPVSCEPCVPDSAHDVVDSGGMSTAAVLKRHGVTDRELRARSYPPAGKLPATVDDWFGLAPLASPETVSESSSLASCGGSSSVVPGLGYQRIMSSVLPPRMDPILQSPARSSNARDCYLHLEPSNVVGDLATLSPCVENLPSLLSPHHHNPDIVPIRPSIVDVVGRGTSVARGGSPDVVLEARSPRNSSASLPTGGQHSASAADVCEVSVECGQHGIVSGCEQAACFCKPDVVCTHAATVHDAVQ